ncbi:hypothetical protein TASIC1_0018004600 [Trichoderma asperellum]|uniref:Uncharacterized protein n=1 Tax=Trichoderma asperellum TaxID=101201 RepID=A0A6V8R5W4_TRIAP|nr:hypothetical protein TASIC1_0018004600 [Trichoderma asperellum]
MAPPLITTDDRLEKAKEAINSSDLFEKTPEYIKEAWEALRRAYEATTSHSDDCLPFPRWALLQFEHERIAKIIHLGYYKDLGLLEAYAPSASEHLDVQPWRFILFFNYIEQGRARVLTNIIKKRPYLTFNQLYEEIQRNRASRIQRKPNSRTEFQPVDYKACCNESSSDDGSDVEIFEGLDDEEGDENIEEADSSEPENVFWPPTENPDLDDHDAQSRSDQDAEERDLPHDRSSCSSLPRSLIIIQKPTNVPDETNATGAAANGVENEARGRDMSPEQPSPWDPRSGSGNPTSVEEQVLQRVPTIVFEINKLVAAGVTAAQLTKTIDEKIEEDMKEMNQVVRQVLQCNKSASSEDLMAAVIPVFSDIEEQHQKRKRQEENIADIHAKKKKFFEELEIKAREARSGADI